MGIPAIRIEVPLDFGTAYDGTEGRQWVDRAQRVSGQAISRLQALGAAKITDEEAFKVIREVLSAIVIDWNLEGDTGPLPKPHGNADAFQALYDSDFRLMDWVATLPFLSVARLLELAESKN